MADQKGDDKAEQKPSSEGYKQEAPELLKFQRHELLGTLLAPGNLLGIIQAYLLLDTAVVGFGVLAFYTGHKVTQEIAFYVSIPLFLVIPVFLWSLRPGAPNKSTDKIGPKKQTLQGRLYESAFGKFLMRIAESRRILTFLNVLGFAGLIWAIARNIRDFPLHPRSSLAWIVYDMALALSLAISNLGRSFSGRITDVYKTIDRLIDVSNRNIELMDKHLKNANTVSNVVADLWVAEEKRKLLAAAEGRNAKVDDTKVPAQPVPVSEQSEPESPKEPAPEKLLGP